MPNVELWIEDYQIELQGDEIIATDYAIAEIGNFATRKGFRSVNFNIPLSANNKRILENPDQVNNLSTRPYRRLKARVYQDGIDQKIRFADIESVTDVISIRLYGGNSSFFDAIKALKISDVDMMTSDHYLNISNVIASRTNTTGYIYPIIDYHADSPNGIINDTDQEIDIRYMFPAIFIDELLSKIAETSGYTLVNNVATDADYQTADLILPFSGGELFRNYDERRYEGFAAVNAPLFPDIPFYGGTGEGAAGSFQFSAQQSNFYGTGTLDLFLFADEVTYTCTYTLVINNANGTPAAIQFGTLDTNSEGTLEPINYFLTTVLAVGMNTISGTFTRTCRITPGNICSSLLFVKNGFANLTYENGTRFELTEVEILRSGAITNAVPNLFNYVTINSIFGDLKQSDIYKAYAQQFCALITVNEETKVVTINKFDTVQDNIPSALDWSDKLDYTTEPEIQFSLDRYAQNNTLKYADDDSVVKPQGTDYIIEIDDDTLEGATDLVEVKYAATQNVSRLNGVSISQIKLFTTDGITEVTEEVEPRILLLQSVAASTIFPSGGLTYTNGTTNTLITTNIPITWFINPAKAFSLGFGINLVPLFWQGLIDVLDKTKIVSANIRLNAVDINQLDFLIPVYIRQYNSFFYISKIQNYRYGSAESTLVELVKLR